MCCRHMDTDMRLPPFLLAGLQAAAAALLHGGFCMLPVMCLSQPPLHLPCALSCTSRGLAVLPGVGFVSGSHDCSLRVWSLEGDVLAELLGHTAIIYHVATTADGLIASGAHGACGSSQCRARWLVAPGLYCCLMATATRPTALGCVCFHLGAAVHTATSDKIRNHCLTSVLLLLLLLVCFCPPPVQAVRTTQCVCGMRAGPACR
jgi:hypothetical protein